MAQQDPDTSKRNISENCCAMIKIRQIVTATFNTLTAKRKSSYLQNLFADTSRVFLIQMGLSGIIRRLKEGKEGSG
jgi:hypothetical protein